MHTILLYGETNEIGLYDFAQTETVTVKGWAVTGFSENGLKKLEYNTDLVIPAEDPNGKKVTAIGENAFKYSAATTTTKITSVQFPRM